MTSGGRTLYYGYVAGSTRLAIVSMYLHMVKPLLKDISAS